ncbi:MAG: bifunctional riboflavin kinase/FAD synthetase [Oscillospiraceae bacterium]|nr:bifunctional riboflavin kinase/FAD synthetase [Oscillospiraceae bacterium]
MKPYNRANIPLAKELRKNMTPWERKLWYDYLRYYPIRFQRQKAIGDYIVDFYCAKARLAIELDGSGHYEPEQERKDTLRTAQLENMNLTIVRICNLDIDKNFAGVCEYIDMIVQNSLPQSASLTAPSSEGALVRGTTEKTIYALGFFDGVHLGHQALLKACRALADARGCKAGAVTFTSHPETVLLGKAPAFINTIDDRRRLLTQYGMDAVVCLPFDQGLMSTPWQDFLDDLMAKDAAGFVCGDDFRFGYRGQGNATLLTDYCRERQLSCVVVPEQLVDGIRVSSTYIRKLLESGKTEEAVQFLGHPHMLTGIVVAGKQLGRTLGIPTANLELPEELVQMKFGVYACKAVVDGKEYLAVTNVGNRPTVGGEKITVEPWLLDFAGDLYGREITVEFYAFLRPEEKFADLTALQTQIRRDGEKTRTFFLEK